MRRVSDIGATAPILHSPMHSVLPRIKVPRPMISSPDSSNRLPMHATVRSKDDGKATERTVDAPARRRLRDECETIRAACSGEPTGRRRIRREGSREAAGEPSRSRRGAAAEPMIY